MSFRKLLAHTTIYGLGDISLLVINYIILIPFLTRQLSPSEYGVIGTISSVSFFLFSFLQLGIPSASLRLYFIYKTPLERKNYFGSVWSFSLIFTIILSLILSLGYQAWFYVSPKISITEYMPYVIWSGFFQVIILFKSVLLRAQNRSKLYVLLDISQFISLVILAIYLILSRNLGVKGQVLAIFYSNMIIAVPSAIVLLKNVNLNLKWRYLKASMPFAFPILFSYITGFLGTRFNILIAQYYVSESAVGILSLGMQIGNLVLLMGASFEKGWQTFLFSQDTENAKEKLQQLIKLAIPAFVLLLLFITLFSPQIISILATKAYIKAWPVIAITAGSSVLFTFSSILNGGLYYEKKYSLATGINIIMALINISFCFILIPKWGIYGSAIATIVSAIFGLTLKILASKKYVGVNFNYWHLTVLPGMGLLTLIFVYLILGSSYQNSGANIIFVKFSSIFLFIGFAIFLDHYLKKGEQSIFRYIITLINFLRKNPPQES